MEMKAGLTFACMNLKKTRKNTCSKRKRYEGKCFLSETIDQFTPNDTGKRKVVLGVIN